MRFSDWSYTDLPHVSLQVTEGKITVRCANLAVMSLYIERNRILSACFLFDLKPEHLFDMLGEGLIVGSSRRSK